MTETSARTDFLSGIIGRLLVAATSRHRHSRRQMANLLRSISLHAEIGTLQSWSSLSSPPANVGLKPGILSQAADKRVEIGNLFLVGLRSPYSYISM